MNFLGYQLMFFSLTRNLLKIPEFLQSILNQSLLGLVRFAHFIAAEVLQDENEELLQAAECASEPLFR